MSKVHGVGPEAQVITNSAGGKQSHSPYAFHLIPPEALFAIAIRYRYGEERGYARDNWRKIPAEEHANHMIVHALAYLAGDRSDEHLEAMICRATMFYTMARQEEQANA
jgi:hypothetical protein